MDTDVRMDGWYGMTPLSIGPKEVSFFGSDILGMAGEVCSANTILICRACSFAKRDRFGRYDWN
jgi:hypothetical protein